MTPFIKWAGGKRQLLPLLKDKMPKNYNTYYEPFVGGGALLLDISPASAIINDINKELIHVYKTIQKHPKELINRIVLLDAYPCDNILYLKNRSLYNQKILKKEYDVELAALFIWINKHCFNGLYRVNKQGLFNVPYNNAGNILTINPDSLMETSVYLQKVTILNQDFETIFQDVKAGDFIFFDSPYDNSFANYSKDGFNEEDHRRLARLFTALSNLGCYCMLTNHNTALMQELYKEFYIQETTVRRAINRDGQNRTGTEIIVTNYLQKEE